MSTQELSRPVPLSQIGAGTERTVAAGPAECAAIAARLRIPAVGALSCRFRLTPERAGAILAEGTLAARVTQDCVVTLEPFEAELSEAFRVRFVPAAQMAGEDEPIDLDADDEVPYEGGSIDLGEAAVEQLALALDPYPRSPAASLGGAVPEGAPEEGGATSPFAALARRARR